MYGLPLEESLPALPGLKEEEEERRTEAGFSLRPHLVDVLYFLKPEMFLFYTLSTFARSFFYYLVECVL